VARALVALAMTRARSIVQSVQALDDLHQHVVHAMGQVEGVREDTVQVVKALAKRIWAPAMDAMVQRRPFVNTV